MTEIYPAKIRDALSHIIDPYSKKDVLSADMISGIVIKDSKVGFVLTIDPSQREHGEHLRHICEQAVLSLPGVEKVTAVLTAQGVEPISPKPEAGYPQQRQRAVWNLTPVEGVRHVIAVASGKGGVGKSTTTVNLAAALSRMGLRVGILDADIYGPSIPHMLGVKDYGKPPIQDNKMQPAQAQGMACMSMGFITGDEAAILRGPMITKTLHQLLRMTRWDKNGTQLDILLVDMPPGTGDVHISMLQQVPLSGVVIVTTPQDVALLDARKCLAMFMRMNVPILGIVENMSYLADEASGARLALFGEGGGKKLAEETQLELLGEVPIDTQIVQATEQGNAYGGIYQPVYDAMAAHMAQRLGSLPHQV